MKKYIQFTTVLFLFVQTIGYSQTATSKKQDSVTVKQDTTIKVDTKNLKKIIGTYNLVEANFTLEIVQEKDKMYIITEFSKDELLLTDEITLHEFTRGVDLQLIEGNSDGLKFSQNGYEATIERVNSKTTKK